MSKFNPLLTKNNRIIAVGFVIFLTMYVTNSQITAHAQSGSASMQQARPFNVFPGTAQMFSNPFGDFSGTITCEGLPRCDQNEYYLASLTNDKTAFYVCISSQVGGPGFCMPPGFTISSNNPTGIAIFRQLFVMDPGQIGPTIPRGGLLIHGCTSVTSQANFCTGFQSTFFMDYTLGGGPFSGSSMPPSLQQPYSMSPSFGSQNWTGSISLFSPILDAFKSKIHTTLNDATTNAIKAVGGGSNSSAVAAFIHPERGFLVYDIFVLDSSNNIHRVIVDPGNGKVLFKQPMSLMDMMFMMHPSMGTAMMGPPGMMMDYGMGGMTSPMGPSPPQGMIQHNMMGAQGGMSP